MTDKLPWFLTHSEPAGIYLSSDFLVLDFETDTAEKGSALHEENDVLLACWVVVRGGKVVKKGHTFGGIYEQQELLDDIASVGFIVAQNLKFELQWLRRCGVELRDLLGYDTMLAEWVMDGNRRNPRNLGALARKYGVPGKLDVVSGLISAGVNTRDINPSWLLEYCHADVEATLQVFLKQRQLVRSQWHLVHVRNLTCSALADIEFEGMTLDKARVMEEYARAVSLKEELGARLAEMSGGINLGSPKQLAVYVYDTLGVQEPTDFRGKPLRTKKGARSASTKVLALIKPKTAEQTEFFTLYKEYNKQVSLLEKNLDYFKLVCEQRDCKFLGLFMQGVVQTHRLASNGLPILFKGQKTTKSVQLQNIPREYKRLFSSGDEDWVVMEPDGGQLEFRVAVELGDDPVGLQEIEDGVDIHSYTAQVLLENGDPEIVGLVPKERRQQSKKSTFRPLYGGSKGSPALEAYCEFFKAKYKGISETQRGWALKCVDQKQFTTAYGMTFYFPLAKIKKSGYISESTKIYNFPIQGFATGEIIPIALVYFWHRTRDMRVKIFCTVHDSVPCKVHKDEVEAAKAVAKQCFTYDVYEFLERVYHYKMHVPLGVGTKVGSHWGSGPETKVDVWPDGREVDRI